MVLVSEAAVTKNPSTLTTDLNGPKNHTIQRGLNTMAKLKKVILLDVETRTTSKDIFDIAWSVVTKHTILKTQNYIVKEVYSEEPAQFFGENQKHVYHQMIQTTLILPWKEIMMRLWEDIKEFDISEVLAYNCAFDIAAIEQTNQAIRGRAFKMFDNLQKSDLYTIFCNTVKDRKDYVRFCEVNNFRTKAGFLKTSAEIAIRFIKDNTEYIECHTALKDVQDEYEIYKWIIKSKKRRVMNSQAFPFRILSANKKKVVK